MAHLPVPSLACRWWGQRQQWWKQRRAYLWPLDVDLKLRCSGSEGLLRWGTCVVGVGTHLAGHSGGRGFCLALFACSFIPWPGGRRCRAFIPFDPQAAAGARLLGDQKPAGFHVGWSSTSPQSDVPPSFSSEKLGNQGRSPVTRIVKVHVGVAEPLVLPERGRDPNPKRQFLDLM